MTVDEFIAKYPQFRQAGSQMIAAALADATDRVDASVFRAKTEQAIGLLAAHLVEISPYGRTLRQDNEDGETKWWKEFLKLRSEVTVKMFVI